MTHEEIVRKLMEMETIQKQNTQGVSNFRAFQLDMTRKVGFVYGATWIAGVLWVIFLGIGGWALSAVVPAANAILQEYYRSHPNAVLREKSRAKPLPWVYANRQEQQDAGTQTSGYVVRSTP